MTSSVSTASTSVSTTVGSPTTETLPSWFVSSKVVRAVFALNNIGVTMIEKGQYDLAITTLEDAFSVVKLYITMYQQPTTNTNDAVSSTTIATSISTATLALTSQIESLYHQAIVRTQPLYDHKSEDNNDDVDSSPHMKKKICRRRDFEAKIITWNSTGCFCFESRPKLIDASVKIVYPIRIEDVNSFINDRRHFAPPNINATGTNNAETATTEASTVPSSGLSASLQTPVPTTSAAAPTVTSSGFESLNMELSLLIQNLGLAYMCSDSYNSTDSHSAAPSYNPGSLTTCGIPHTSTTRQGIHVGKKVSIIKTNAAFIEKSCDTQRMIYSQQALSSSDTCNIVSNHDDDEGHRNKNDDRDVSSCCCEEPLQKNQQKQQQYQGIQVARALVCNSVLLTLKEHEKLHRLLRVTRIATRVSSSALSRSSTFSDTEIQDADACLLQYLVHNFTVLIAESESRSLCTEKLVPVMNRMTNLLGSNVRIQKQYYMFQKLQQEQEQQQPSILPESGINTVTATTGTLSNLTDPKSRSGDRDNGNKRTITTSVMSTSTTITTTGRVKGEKHSKSKAPSSPATASGCFQAPAA